MFQRPGEMFGGDPTARRSGRPVVARVAMASALSLVAVSGMALFGLGDVLAQGTAEPESKSMFDALVESGFMGGVIVLCSIVGVSLAITFAFQIRHDVLVPPELLDQLQALFDDEDYEEAYHVCEANPSFLSSVIASGLAHLDDGYEEMQTAMIDAGENEATRLHQKVGYLSLIANVSPMLGLLGTVTGMILTFNKLATATVAPKPKDLASGISVALGTTFLGLLVAIPMTVVFVYFRNRVINVVVEVSSITDELMSRFKAG